MSTFSHAVPALFPEGQGAHRGAGTGAVGAAQGTGVVAWTGFGVALSLATPARGLQGGTAGAVGAAASRKGLERAELLWLRARPGWCVRGIFHQQSCRCSEQLESWGVAVTFCGKVVKRSV